MNYKYHTDCVCIWCVYSDFYDKKITSFNRYKRGYKIPLINN